MKSRLKPMLVLALLVSFGLFVLVGIRQVRLEGRSVEDALRRGYQDRLAALAAEVRQKVTRGEVGLLDEVAGATADRSGLQRAVRARDERPPAPSGRWFLLAADGRLLYPGLPATLRPEVNEAEEAEAGRLLAAGRARFRAGDVPGAQDAYRQLLARFAEPPLEPQSRLLARLQLARLEAARGEEAARALLELEEELASNRYARSPALVAFYRGRADRLAVGLAGATGDAFRGARDRLRARGQRASVVQLLQARGELVLSEADSKTPPGERVRLSPAVRAVVQQGLDGQYRLAIEVSEETGRALEAFTTKRVGERVAIRLDGRVLKEITLSAPLGRRVVLEGGFREPEARALARLLREPSPPSLEVVVEAAPKPAPGTATASAPASVEDPIAALRSAHVSRDRARIAREEKALISRGSSILEAVWQAYEKEKQFQLKVSLQYVLLALRGGVGAETLIDRMRTTRDAGEKMRLAFMLLKLGDEDLPAIETALRSEKDPMIRKYLIRALGGLSSGKGVQTLAQLARKGTDRQERIEAIRALERKRSPEVAKLLVDLAVAEQGRDAQIRSIAIRALARNVAGRDQSPFFGTVLQQDERTNNRAEAVRYFERVGSAEDLPMLEGALQQERVYYIRQKIEKAVRQIKKRSGTS